MHVETYLLDTSALSPLIDPTHAKHVLAEKLILNLNNAPIYVSVLALAEMMYGLMLYEKAHGAKLPNADHIVREALRFPRLDVEKHTAAEYASLKSTVAQH